MTGTAPDDESNIPPSPRGTWFDLRPNGFQVGASTRSISALFHVPFAAVWTVGTLLAFYSSLPAYLSALESANAQTDLLVPVAFFVASVWLNLTAAMTVAGNVTITVEGNVGTVFIGVGSVGWKRRFDWTAQTPVELGRGRGTVRGPGFSSGVIVLGGTTRVWYSGLLSKDQKRFIVHVLKETQNRPDRAV